ncbi:MAG: hypothetical protein IIZ48_05930 [Erysipelotrichales bacterium]|nr:hypothetical protein [Erysipelotrichales bacterium]
MNEEEIRKEVEEKLNTIVDAAKDESQKVFESAKRFYDAKTEDDPKETEDAMNMALDKLKEVLNKGVEAVKGLFPEDAEKEEAKTGDLKKVYDAAVLKVKNLYEGVANNPDVQKTMAEVSDAVSKSAGKASETVKNVWEDEKVQSAVNTVKESAGKLYDAAKDGYDKAMENPAVKDTVDTVKRGFAYAADKVTKLFEELTNKEDK